MEDFCCLRPWTLNVGCGTPLENRYTSLETPLAGARESGDDEIETVS